MKSSKNVRYVVISSQKPEAKRHLLTHSSENPLKSTMFVVKYLQTPATCDEIVTYIQYQLLLLLQTWIVKVEQKKKIDAVTDMFTRWKCVGSLVIENLSWW